MFAQTTHFVAAPHGFAFSVCGQGVSEARQDRSLTVPITLVIWRLQLLVLAAISVVYTLVTIVYNKR